MKLIYVLLSVIIVGCTTKTTTHIEVGGLVIDGENISVSGSFTKDTVYIHDTVYVKLRRNDVRIETNGDNSPAIISDKPVNIKYGYNNRISGVGELEPHIDTLKLKMRN